jgi:hypothetical protein
MFINKHNKDTFELVKSLGLILFLSFFSGLAEAQQLIKGTIMDNDSITPMPFVYIVNKSNGNGTMSDNNGRFIIYSENNDTLICSYIGYAKLYTPVKTLVKDSKGEVTLVMRRMLINLNMVTITTFKIKPYERDYMKKIIDENKIRKLDYISSPITSLYMTYSKEGKQIRKLAKIFEEILIEEEVQKRLSADILRQLTGDDKIEYEAFRKYCVEANNLYIISHEGVDLYSRVMECYRRYKAEGRR